MFKLLIFIGVFITSFYAQSQSRFLIGNGKYKYLPLELSLSYQNPDYIGFRVGVENAILVRNNMEVVLGKPVYSKKEVLTNLYLRNLLFNYSNENHHEIQLGFTTSFRKTFGFGLVLEPILGYQYGYAYNTASLNRLAQKHEILFQMGLGYTKSLKELSTTLFFFRPGFSVELSSETKKLTQFIIDIGVQFRLPNLRVKRWNKPWFSKRKKPNEEFEFMGRNAGNPSGKNLSERKRNKLNKKRRKYKTGKKKMKSKKKKK